MERFICIHGHFYQPPRESPWLESIELQDSAAPYHDWNERIAAECYSPNATSRVLDGEGRIRRIVNNYSKISFNFGPTLLSWMEEHDPETYGAILQADRESRERFSGHGSALAQAYNHVILPLANARDKRTQILWGLRDFERRFGRRAEGMWLPETAVDLETLDLLAEHGITFTILSPHQARRVRPIGRRQWQSVEGGSIDPTRPYRVRLPSRRRLALFFYDGPISRAVAFEDVLKSGEGFAHRLAGAFSDARTHDQLVHIASDGETYGHHHAFGDMALAYALQHIEDDKLARLTNYAQYLAAHPPAHEVEIFDETSWSCCHGVDRWRRHCGCSSGAHPDWNQHWRKALRVSLDWLRDTVAPLYEDKASVLLKDPWAARDAYIDVVLARTPESVEAFFAAHARRPLSEEERTAALKMLEMQRHAMLMFTSCGWFFDEISGIETVQVLQYAARVLQLAGETLGRDLEGEFLRGLRHARSNLPGLGDGSKVYEKFVRPARVDLIRVGAHYAVSSLFEPEETGPRVFCYDVAREGYRLLAQEGGVRLALGKARIVSRLTGEPDRVVFGVLHLGDHRLVGGARRFESEELFEEAVREATDLFGRSDVPELQRFIEKHFGSGGFSMDSLFKDEQRKVLRHVLSGSFADVRAGLLGIYEQQAPLMDFLVERGYPLPRLFRTVAKLILDRSLEEALEASPIEESLFRSLIEEERRHGASPDLEELALVFQRRLEALSKDLARRPDDRSLLDRMGTLMALAKEYAIPVKLWKVQNNCYRLFMDVRSGGGDDGLLGRLTALGVALGIRLDAGAPEKDRTAV